MCFFPEIKKEHLGCSEENHCVHKKVRGRGVVLSHHTNHWLQLLCSVPHVHGAHNLQDVLLICLDVKYRSARRDTSSFRRKRRCIAALFTFLATLQTFPTTPTRLYCLPNDLIVFLRHVWVKKGRQRPARRAGANPLRRTQGE